MKKILYSLFAFTLAFPIMANAATFSFSPSSGSFAPGETFNIAVYANPGAGEEITVAKFSATFSPSILEVVSFSQAVDWMPLVAPGSDLIDNEAGKLLKTGGYPLRLTEPKQFGTIILKAKSVGTATLSIEGDSMFLDIANTNKYASSLGANFTIETRVPVSTPPPSITPTPSSITPTPTSAISTPAVEEVVESTPPTTTPEEVVPETQEQQLSQVVATSAKTFWYYVSGAIIILFLIGLLVWKKREKTSQ